MKKCKHGREALMQTYGNAARSLVLVSRQKTASVENDCACATAPVIALATETQQAFRQGSEVKVFDGLPEEFKLLLSPWSVEGPVVLNAAAWKRWQSFQRPQPLSEAVDFALAEQNLLLPERAAPRLLPPRADMFTVWLHVTNACNLACPYCYVRKSSDVMHRNTGQKAIEAAFQTARQRGFQGVKFKYAGGEPTLHFSLVQHLVVFAQDWARQTGLRLEQVLLSNGTRMDAAQAAWLREHEVKIMLSLDGIGADHDRMRFYPNGRGSFTDVQSTIDDVLLPLGMHPMVSITVTRWNAAGIADTVRWALERNLPVSLNFYRHTPQAPEDLAIEEDLLVQGMLSAYAVFEEFLPEEPFFDGLLDRAQRRAHQYTCGVNWSYVAVDHQGHVAQCQMMLDEPAEALNTKDDLLSLARQGAIQTMPVEEKDLCRHCVYRHLCAGGCPLETYRVTGRWDAPSPNCSIYRRLFPAALRLEGLRLLKQHGLLK